MEGPRQLLKIRPINLRTALRQLCSYALPLSTIIPGYATGYRSSSEYRIQTGCVRVQGISLHGSATLFGIGLPTSWHYRY